VNNRSESSSKYNMIIRQNLDGESGIIMNFNDQMITWDTDNIAKEPQTLRDEYSQAKKILMLIISKYLQA
jgi:hypothetical protein